MNSRATKSKAPIRNPRGGLTAAGRAMYARKEGAHLRPGVKGPADTPEKMRRKGSFLRRHHANPRGPMRDANGNPTRLALAAHAWGEPVPKTMAAASALAAKGTRLLERYRAVSAGDGAARASGKGAPTQKTRARKAAAENSAHRAGKKTEARKSVKKTTTRKTTAEKGAHAASAKNSLVANINRRRKAGISRSKSNSTVSEDAYANMRAGWPKGSRKRNAG